jgi:hypothetical protein
MLFDRSIAMAFVVWNFKVRHVSKKKGQVSPCIDSQVGS